MSESPNFPVPNVLGFQTGRYPGAHYQAQPGMPMEYGTSHRQASQQPPIEGPSSEYVPLLSVPPADIPLPPGVVRQQSPRRMSATWSSSQGSASPSVHNAWGRSYSPRPANDSYFPYNSGGLVGQQNPPPMTPPRSQLQGPAGDWNAMAGSYSHSGQSASGPYFPHPPAGFCQQNSRPMHAASPYQGPADVRTSLHAAAEEGDIDVLLSLLKRRVDVNGRNASNQTPLDTASRKGNLNVVRLLIEWCADADSRDMWGWTPLHYASQHGYLEVARLLIDNGANVNARKHDYWTPIHLSSTNGHLGIVNLLLERGAGVHAINDQGETPYQASLQRGYTQIANLLRKHARAEQGSYSHQSAGVSQRPASVQSASGGPYPTTLVTKKRKALVVGINYSRHQDRRFKLKCCIGDAHHIADFLHANLRFAASDIRLMTDETTTPSCNHPTKENILGAMRGLVRDAQPQDSFFFYFSGHGVQIEDLDGDEPDGLDECICAMDYHGDDLNRNASTPGLIVDDIMHQIMVKSLPPGCHLTAIFDSCHSGTVLDLPHIYRSDGVVKLFRHPYRLEVLRQKESKAVAISLSASKDDQKARETYLGGALRRAFIDSIWKSNNTLSYKKLIQAVREYMKRNKIRQRPQLSSSHEIDITNLQFIV